jgi:hypothetical protein
MQQKLKIENPDGSVFKVVDAREIETATIEGWQLVEVLPWTDVIGIRSELVVVPPTFNGGYSQERFNNISEYGTVHRFLVRKGSETMIAELNKEIGSQNRAIAAKTKEVNDALALQKKSVETIETRDRRIKDIQTELDLGRDRNTKLQTLMHKLEGDLAKVRKEIGEREWARIIDGAAMPPVSR